MAKFRPRLCLDNTKYKRFHASHLLHCISITYYTYSMLIIITTSCTIYKIGKVSSKKGFLHGIGGGSVLSLLVASRDGRIYKATHKVLASKKREKGTRHLIMSTKTKCRLLIVCFILSILSRLKGNLLILAVKTSILSIRWHWIGEYFQNKN